MYPHHASANLYVECTMETSNNGIIIKVIRYKTTRYADDIAILENNEEALQNVLHQINRILKDKSDTTIKNGKTKIMKYMFRNGKPKAGLFRDDGKCKLIPLIILGTALLQTGVAPVM